MSRGRVAVIRDPAIAIAAAKCWLARWGTSPMGTAIPINAHHPQDCGFCDYPDQKLIDAVTEFMAWADPPVEIGEPSALRPEVEAFLSLSQADQRLQVQKAQGYVDDEAD